VDVVSAAAVSITRRVSITGRAWSLIYLAGVSRRVFTLTPGHRQHAC
jgi:hypothetical protein